MARLTEVHIPDLGDAGDVSVIEVLVAVGDTVHRESPIVTLESDKASMDVPSPVEGVVEQVHVAVGDHVQAGTLVLTVADADGEAPAEPGPAQAVPGPAAAGPAAERPVAAAEPAAGQPAAAAEQPAAPAEQPAAALPAAAGALHASPLARRLARELGVDLALVDGTGHEGRISKEDVLAHAAQGEGAAPAEAAAAPAQAAPAGVDFARFGPVEVAPRSRIRRLAGAHLQRSWNEIPHVTQHDEADVTDLEAFRVQVNAEQAGSGVKLTMVALLLKASVAALQQYPAFNSSLAGEELVLKRYYHLGVAVDTPDGLVVPVLRDVDRKGLLELARELAEVSGRAREGKLTPADLQGGTFTISSLGGIGGTAFTPIVNSPQVAILGVSRAATRPVWDGSGFVPRLVLPLSLSYDHRVIDGAAAARFTGALAALLRDLRRTLL